MDCHPPACTQLAQRPQLHEFHEFYNTYVSLVPDGQCESLLVSQLAELQVFFDEMSDADAAVTHPPYTWTIKQVVGHLIDTERIFADRIHRFSSGEVQPQPGIDQDAYVANQDYETPTLTALVEEFLFCRQANVLLIRRLKPTAFDRQGLASGFNVSVRALVWMLVGHVIHHMKIVRQRV